MKTYVLTLFLVLMYFNVQSQITNNGAKINIASGIVVTAGDFTNQTSTTDGEIILDGTLQINGNFINNSSGNVFADIESNPDGTVIFTGKNKEISGENPIFFENVKINNSTILKNDNCKIYGILSLNGKLDLNGNTLYLEYASPNAINYTSGYIKSETDENTGFGIISWKIGNNTGEYDIPFGTDEDSTNNLNLKISITDISSTGYFNFATYPTNYLNAPQASDMSLTDIDALSMIDRFWIINPDFSAKPDFTAELMFSDNDLNLQENTNINIDSLTIIRYNPNQDLWTDIKIHSTISNNTIQGEIKGSEAYKWFSVASYQTVSDLIIPNGITPNNDNFNDTWIIEGCTNCKVYIYNRWGNKIYYSDNYDNSWDGGNNPSGAYYYVIITPENKTIKGVVNILR